MNKWDIEIVTDVSDRIAGSHDSDGKMIAVPLTPDLQ